MENRRNITMMFIALFVLIISAIVHLLHRLLGSFEEYLIMSGTYTPSTSFETVMLIILFSIPVVLLTAAFVLFRRQSNHSSIPLLVTLSLVFGSISIIAGGNGMVEYHFSIFMVLAALAYFERIHLILISAAIFAVHHVVGYFTVPEIICGSADYPFSLLLIHAVFVVFISAAIIIQIIVRQRFNERVEEITEQANRVQEQMMQNIGGTSETVLQNAVQLESGSSEISSATEQSVASLQVMVNGAEEQFDYAVKSQDALKEVVANVASINDQLNVSKNTSQQASEEARNGLEEMEETVEQMADISASTDRMGEVVERVERRSNEIQHTLTMMTDIAEQTNLLALNAAIEAARAGEEGKGFAVVAEEVRNLADLSNKHADEISHVLHDLIQDTADLATEMTETQQTTVIGTDKVKNTNSIFTTIVDRVNEVNELLDTTFAMAENIGTNANEVNEFIDVMISVSNRNKDDINDISAASEEQLQTLLNMEGVTAELREVANNLNVQIEDIKVV